MSTNGPTCTCDAIEVTAKCPACPTAADQTPATEAHEYVTCTDRKCARPHFIGSEYVDPNLRAALTVPAIQTPVFDAVPPARLLAQTILGTRQTPATDSEREALIALLLKHGHAEWDRFDAQIVADIVIADWAAPLLAEQAATIERLAAIAAEYGEDYIDAVDAREVHESLAAALGSQRTEGQG